MLLNCLSIVILNYFGQKKFVLLGSLEVFKDLPIAFLAAFISRYIPRIGHLNSIITGLSIAFILCIITPFVDDFWFFKIWFLLIGLCFILVKISVLYITINLSKAEENGSRFMQFIEASFMAGIVIVNLINKKVNIYSIHILMTYYKILNYVHIEYIIVVVNYVYNFSTNVEELKVNILAIMRMEILR
jgi:hypothetical protein